MNKRMYQIFNKVQENHWWFQARNNIVRKNLSDIYGLTKKRILDIGCGSGLMIETLHKTYDIYGLEKSRIAINLSKKINKSRIKQGYLPEKVPFKKKFDAILMMDVLEHIEDDFTSLLVINKLLKRKGLLIITVPAFMFLWSKFDEENHHKRRYKINELRYLLKQSGFSLEKITYYNFFLSPIAFIERLLIKVFSLSATQSLKVPIKPLNNFFYFLFNAEYSFLKYLDFPFGLSIIAIARKDKGNGFSSLK